MNTIPTRLGTAMIDGRPVDFTDPASASEAIAASPHPVIVSLSRLRRSIPVGDYRAIEAEVRARLGGRK
ncbi:hypothetical protein ACFJIY_07485 [Pimelobacter simplex]|uniref:hypothetical protein n=1 Tax=Nocardioides simplex TaxID=2045 RepID=UPI00366BEB48